MTETETVIAVCRTAATATAPKQVMEVSSERVFCKYCSQTKSLSDFSAANVGKGRGEDGLRSGRCKACHAKYNAQYVSNRPRVLEPTVRFKTCSSCKEQKTAAEFPTNKLSKDGLLHNCRQCQREQEAKTQSAQRFVAAPQVAKKECIKCHVVKDAKDFTPHIRSKDGLNAACRSCASQYHRARAAALKEKRQQGALSEHVAFKVCQRCHLGQSAAAFTKDSSRPDGLHVWCKACRSNARQETKAAKQQLGPLVSHKTCRTCTEEKAAAEFVRNAAAVDGLHHSCKACHSARAKARTLAKAKTLEGSEAPPVTVTSKRCPGCKEVKPAECFGRVSTVYSASGLAIYCKPCKSQQDKRSRERRRARHQQAAAAAAAPAPAAAAGRTGFNLAAEGLGAGSRKRQRDTSSNKGSNVPADSGSAVADCAVPSKRCPGCKQIKPAECFGRMSTLYSASGLQGYCKPCKNQRSKQSVERKRAQQQQAAAAAAAAAAAQGGRTGGKPAAKGPAETRKRKRETSSNKESSVPARGGSAVEAGAAALEAAAGSSASKRRKRRKDATTAFADVATDSCDDLMTHEQPRSAALAGVGAVRSSRHSRFVITSDDLEEDALQEEQPRAAAAAAAAAGAAAGSRRGSKRSHYVITSDSLADDTQEQKEDTAAQRAANPSSAETNGKSSTTSSDSGEDEDENTGSDRISSSDSDSDSDSDSESESESDSSCSDSESESDSESGDRGELDWQQSESVSESESADDSGDADWSAGEGLAGRAVSQATAGQPVLRQRRKLQQQDPNQQHQQNQPTPPPLQQQHQQQEAGAGVVGCGAPLPLPGQLQVLGQTMTPHVADAFRSAVELQGRRLSVKLLTNVGSRRLQRTMQAQLERYLCKHIPLQKGVAALTSWPSSLPMHPHVEAYMLPPKQSSTHIAASGRPLTSCPLLPGAGSGRSSSSNASLAAQRGMRVKQQGGVSWPAVSAGAVIGPFDGLQAFAHEMPGIAAKPLPGWQGSTLQWQLQFDAFSMDMADFNVPVKVCREEAEIAEAAGQPLALAVCALLHGNETALINDSRPDPLSQPVLNPTDPQPNVMVVEVEVGGWVFPFAVATADVGPGQELLLDYGQEYWEGRRVELQTAAQRGPGVKRLRRRPDGTLLPGQVDHVRGYHVKK